MVMFFYNKTTIYKLPQFIGILDQYNFKLDHEFNTVEMTRHKLSEASIGPYDYKSLNL